MMECLFAFNYMDAGHEAVPTNMPFGVTGSSPILTQVEKTYSLKVTHYANEAAVKQAIGQAKLYGALISGTPTSTLIVVPTASDLAPLDLAVNFEKAAASQHQVGRQHWSAWPTACLRVGEVRWHELEALGCCRGAQRAVEGREFRAAFVDPAHSESSGQLDCVISSKAMRCAQPGRLVEEGPSDCDGGETRGLRAGPEVVSLEIGGKQSRVAGRQFTHALLPPQCRRNLHPGQ